MDKIVISKNNVPIRFTDERWQHITTGYSEMTDYYYEILEAVENPEILYEGDYGGVIAISNKLGNTNKFIIVIYKEISESDGSIITAYYSNKMQVFEKKKILWKKQ